MIHPRNADGTFAPLWRVKRPDGSERVIRHVDPLMPAESPYDRLTVRWLQHGVALFAIVLGVLCALAVR